MQDRLPGKLNLVAFLADALDHNLLAFLQFIADVANAAVGDVGNVQQTISARKDFDESAEIDDPADGADVGLAHFSFGRQPANPRDCRVGGASVRGSDRNGTVVFDIDLRTSLFDESAND